MLWPKLTDVRKQWEVTVITSDKQPELCPCLAVHRMSKTRANQLPFAPPSAPQTAFAAYQPQGMQHKSDLMLMVGGKSVVGELLWRSKPCHPCPTSSPARLLFNTHFEVKLYVFLKKHVDDSAGCARLLQHSPPPPRTRQNKHSGKLWPGRDADGHFVYDFHKHVFLIRDLPAYETAQGTCK